MSAAYISIGIFASSISTNQIVGYLLALVIGIFFQIIFGYVAMGMSGFIGEIFNYLSLTTHYESMARGVIDSKDLIFFLSIIIFGLSLTVSNLAKNRL